jgi:hypothetical protein
MAYTRHRIPAYITYWRRYGTYDYADTQSLFCNKQARSSSGDHVQGYAAEIFSKEPNGSQMMSKVRTCQQVMQVNTI